MMYWMFAGLCFLLWFIGDRSGWFTKGGEIGIMLKYVSLVFIGMLLFIDAFFFIETSRMIEAQMCGNETCCPKFEAFDKEIYGNSIAILSGIYQEGSVNSTWDPDDGNSYIAYVNSSGLSIEENYTAVNTSFVKSINLQTRFNGSGTRELYIYRGGSWEHIYSLLTSEVWINTVIDIPPVNQPVIRLLWNSTGAGTNDSFEIDQMTLNGYKKYTMYCPEDAEVGTIIAYHRTEYEIIGLMVSNGWLLLILIEFLVVIGALLTGYRKAQEGSDIIRKR